MRVFIRTIGFLIILLSLVLCGCTKGAVPAQDVPEPSPSFAAKSAFPSEPAQALPASRGVYERSYRFNGDDEPDYLEVSEQMDSAGERIITVSARLGGGGVFELAFDSRALSVRATAGDVDGDGLDELVVFSKIMSERGRINIYALGSEGFEEVKQHGIHENEALLLAQPRNMLNADLTDAYVHDRNGQDVLYIKFALEGEAGQYLELALKEDGWHPLETGVCFAHSEGRFALAGPKRTEPTKKLNSIRREGYLPPVIVHVKGEHAGGDERYGRYDAAFNKIRRPNAELAKTAARGLYDMTGLQLPDCYVYVYENYANSTYYHQFDFFLDKARPNELIYSARVDPFSGELMRMVVQYKESGSYYAYFSDADCAVPENIDQMDDLELARWYYEHSTFGDRQAVARTNRCGLCQGIQLVTGSGEYYEVFLNENRRPWYIYDTMDAEKWMLHPTEGESE